MLRHVGPGDAWDLWFFPMYHPQKEAPFSKVWWVVDLPSWDDITGKAKFMFQTTNQMVQLKFRIRVV